MLTITETVVGKWNKNKYIVLSKLGQGGVGVVYKVKDNKGHVKALKISRDINSITREFNMISTFRKIKHIPRAYDIDDYVKGGIIYYFFIMDYIEGYNLKQVIKSGSIKVQEIIGIGIILLNILEKIYKLGYVYADIKPENIMIDKRRKNVSFIDFGGVIEKEQGIREYTPAYSMLSWGLDGDNDYMNHLVFSIAMMITCMMLKKEFNPLIDNLDTVISNLKILNIDNRFKKVLIKALMGEIKSISLFRDDLKKIFKQCNPSLVVTSGINTRIKINKKVNAIIDIIFMFSIGLFLIAILACVNIYL